MPTSHNLAAEGCAGQHPAIREPSLPGWVDLGRRYAAVAHSTCIPSVTNYKLLFHFAAAYACFSHSTTLIVDLLWIVDA